MTTKSKSKHLKSRRDIYQEVTDLIIQALEQGTVPWQNPIIRSSGDGWPKNLHSGKRYRGINVLLLTMRAFQSGYSSDYWLTYKQAAAKGGAARKGEKGSLVTFWKMLDSKDKETGQATTVPVLKHYVAFNLEQIEGIAAPDIPVPSLVETFEPNARAQAIVDGYKDPPTILHDGGSRAFYRPHTDTVHMPVLERFETSSEYFATLFHELSHSTGAQKRLNRGFETDPAPFGSPDYGREELIAEASAAFLCAATGISSETIEQSAAYLQGWVNLLKGDKRLIVTAASAAQKSADWILGDTFQAAAQHHQQHNLCDTEPQSLNPQHHCTQPHPVTASGQMELF